MFIWDHVTTQAGVGPLGETDGLIETSHRREVSSAATEETQVEKKNGKDRCRLECDGQCRAKTEE